MDFIDSHVHLFSEPHLSELAWMTPDSLLYANHRVQEYLECCHDLKARFKGLVFVEVDVKSGLNEDSWTLPLEEFAYLTRVVLGTTTEQSGEGAAIPEGASALIGIVPWAPVPAGRDQLAKYLQKMHDIEPSVFSSRVKGFRYLVQDKPKGTMLDPTFIEGVDYLASKGYVFDLGIDTRSGGLWQLEEAVELASKVSKDTVFIINHLTKANYRVPVESVYEDAGYRAWEFGIKSLYKHTPNSFVKLSGGFSELPEGSQNDLEQAADRIFPWFKVFWATWGPSKIIWGSDWPVSKFGAGQDSIRLWYKVSTILLEKIGATEEQKRAIFHTNALAAYNLVM